MSEKYDSIWVVMVDQIWSLKRAHRRRMLRQGRAAPDNDNVNPTWFGTEETD